MLKPNYYYLEIAKKFGVSSSVLLAYLDRCKEDADGRISLSREQIYTDTGLKEVEQVDAEAVLFGADVMSVSPFKGNDSKNYYTVYWQKVDDALKSDVTEDDPFGMSMLFPQKRTAPVSTKSKREKNIESLKSAVMRNANGKVSDVVLPYLCDWVDAVYANPKGFLTTEAVAYNIDDLLAFTRSDDVQIAVMKIAVKNGHRDIKWSIEMYKKENGRKSSTEKDVFGSYEDTRARQDEVSSEVF